MKVRHYADLMDAVFSLLVYYHENAIGKLSECLCISPMKLRVFCDRVP